MTAMSYFQAKTGDGQDVYLAFESLEEQKDGRRVILPYEEGVTYRLNLPFVMVTPWLADKKFGAFVYLNLDHEIFSEVCQGLRILIDASPEVLKDLEERARPDKEGETPYIVPWRDKLLVKGGLSVGLRFADAVEEMLTYPMELNMLASLPPQTAGPIERYLFAAFPPKEGAGLRSIVLPPSVASVLLSEEKFLNGSSLHEAYYRVFVRMRRTVTFYRQKAPYLIQVNERIMLQKAIMTLFDELSVI